MIKVWLFIVLFLCSGTVNGQPVPKDNTPVPVEPSRFSVQAWTTADGLPANFIKSIYQSSDGYIWASTFHGLARFDGKEWISFDIDITPEWHVEEVLSVCEMQSGDLWVSGTSGAQNALQVIPESDRYRSSLRSDAIKRMKCLGNGAAIVHDIEGLTVYADSVVSIAGTDTLSSHPLGDALIDKKGRLWVNFYDGLFSYDLSTNERITYTETDGLKRGEWLKERRGYSEGITHFYEDLSGRLFLISDTRIQLFEEGAFKTIFEPNNLSPLVGIANLTSLPESGLWSIDASRIFRFGSSMEAVAELRDDEGYGIKYVRQVFEDSKGEIWFSVNNNLQEGGLYLLREKGLHRIKIDGLDVGLVWHIIEDREGNVWLATNVGVVKMTRRKGTVLTKKQGLWDNEVYALLEGQDGTMWMGTWGNGVQFYRDGLLSGYNTHHGLVGNYVRSLWEETDGSIVVGSESGLSIIRPDQSISSIPYSEYENTRSLLRTSKGKLLVGRNASVFLLNNDGTYAPQIESTTRAVNSLLEDQEGGLWAGTWHGLFRNNGKDWKRVNNRQAPQEHVLSLYESSNGDLWIGTRYDGLYRRTATGYFHYQAEHGLPFKTVINTREDTQGGMWITTENGLALVHKEDLVRVAEGEQDAFTTTMFTVNDGLAYEEFSVSPNSIEQDESGALWFASQGGVLIIDSQEKSSNTVPPHVDIQSLAVNGAAVPLGETHFTLSRNNHLEFKAASLSFTSPGNNRLKGRLVGFDAEWKVNESGVFEYINVPAGRYTFEVTGSNNDGVWSERIVTYSVLIQTPLAERGFFWPLIFLVITTPVGVLIYQVQRRRKSERELAHQKAINEQHVTRERIRRSLHSGVLNTMSTIHLSLDLASQIEGLSAEEEEMFKSHKELTYGLGRQMRESMWLLDREEDYLTDIARAMKTVLKKATLLQHTSFDASNIEKDVRLTPLQKLNIFLIFREAVQNSVKYSEAERIVVDLSFVDGELILVIIDDGKGFAGDEKKGHGLAIMKSQAEEIDGTLDIESVNKEGTSIMLRVPLP